MLSYQLAERMIIEFVEHIAKFAPIGALIADNRVCAVLTLATAIRLF
jgi:hypothetical protein